MLYQQFLHYIPYKKHTIFTHACPKAGPIGGAGVALPASIANLIIPTTFLAIFFLSFFVLTSINKVLLSNT